MLGKYQVYLFWKNNYVAISLPSKGLDRDSELALHREDLQGELGLFWEDSVTEMKKWNLSEGNPT